METRNFIAVPDLSEEMAGLLLVTMAQTLHTFCFVNDID
jgi:hypothetical protein